MAVFTFPQQSVSIPGVATEATLLQVETNTANTVTELQTLNASDLATETTLASRASEATLVSLEAKDFATQTTLATRASEATLASLEAKDFATETTLASLEAKDFATETTLATKASESTLSSLSAKTASSLFTEAYDTIQVTSKTVDGPTEIVTKTGGLAGTVVQTLTIAYDVDGDFESAVVS